MSAEERPITTAHLNAYRDFATATQAATDACATYSSSMTKKDVLTRDALLNVFLIAQFMSLSRAHVIIFTDLKVLDTLIALRNGVADVLAHSYGHSNTGAIGTLITNARKFLEIVNGILSTTHLKNLDETTQQALNTLERDYLPWWQRRLTNLTFGGPAAQDSTAPEEPKEDSVAKRPAHHRPTVLDRNRRAEF